MKQNTKNLLVVGCVIIIVSALGAINQYRTSKKVEQAGVDFEPGATSLPVLLELGSHECIPCKQMMPILAELTEEYKGRLDVKFIDVKAEPGQVEKYGIRLIPTQIFFDEKGSELFRHEGFYQKESILAKFSEHGIDLSKAEEMK